MIALQPRYGYFAPSNYKVSKMANTKNTSQTGDTRSAWKAPQLKSFVPVRETQGGPNPNPLAGEGPAYAPS